MRRKEIIMKLNELEVKVIHMNEEDVIATSTPSDPYFNYYQFTGLGSDKTGEFGGAYDIKYQGEKVTDKFSGSLYKINGNILGNVETMKSKMLSMTGVKDGPYTLDGYNFTYYSGSGN